MIISFYSYKGGVGRSQLCANVASYLCHRKDKKVLLMDWDFEAPGLHYFFGKSNDDINSNGTIELLKSYSDLMRTQSSVNEKDYPFYPAESMVSMAKAPNGDGKIDYIPAGNYNESYVFNVNNFDWYEFYELLDGKTYIESLKHWLKALEYDYIFIDSRTGINDYSGICNIQLPDTNVVVMAANNQNIDGCKRIIDQIINSEYTQREYRKPYVFPVLSRISTDHTEYPNWSEKFTDRFHHLIPVLDCDIDPAFSWEVMRDFYLTKTLLIDEPKYSAGENLLITNKKHPIPRESFMSKFANLAEYILGIDQESNIGLFDQIDVETWLQWAGDAEERRDKNKAAIAYENGKEYEKVIELGGTAFAHFKVGNDLFVKGEVEKAIEHYEKSVDLAPNVHVTCYNMGNAFRLLKQFEQAIKVYQKALEIKPDYHEAYNNMGIAYRNLKQHKDAITAYQKAIEIKPDKYEAFNNMGVTYDELNQYENAINTYHKAIEIKPNYHEAFNNMGNAYDKLKQYKNAITAYQKAIEIKPDFHEAYFNMGNSYAKLEQYEDAIQNYKKTIEIKPDYYEAFNGMGFANIYFGDLKEAEMFLQKAVEIGVTDSGTMNLAHVYLCQRKKNDALDLYLKSYQAFKNKEDFWKDMNDDFKILTQYNIERDTFDELLAEIRQRVETQN